MPAPRHAPEKVGSPSTYLSGPSCSVLAAVRLPLKHHEEKAAEKQHGRGPSQPHDVGDHGAVSPGLGIVVIAVQRHLVDYGANLVARSLDQAEANIFGREFNSVVVLSDLAGVYELSGALVAAVVEA